MEATALEYLPGSSAGVVHNGVAILLDLDAGSPLVARVYQSLLDDGDVDDVLDVLAATGLKGLASFGAFQVRPDGIRLVIRGDMQGRAGSDEWVRAQNTMWNDSWRPECRSVRVQRPETTGATTLPITSGIVLAGALAIRSVAPEVQEPTGTEPAVTGVVPNPEPGVAPKPEPGVAPSAPHPGEVFAAAAALPAVATASEEPVTGDEFDHLFGATQRAPLPPPDPEPKVLDPSPSAAEPAHRDPSQTMPSPLTVPSSELPTEASGSAPGPALITGMPWASEPAATVAPEPPRAAAPQFVAQTPAPIAWQPVVEPASPPVPSGPAVEDMTVNRSALRAASSSVLVVAARCANGHLSPAYAGTCRVCRAAVPQQQPVEIPRPTLGQLRLSTGGVVTLDRPAVLGRAPRVPSSYQGEQPNLVQLVDPGKDVSGQHLEVSLDYWNVVVRDLGSTNGTEVILPGEMPVALRANDPVIIEPGTRVVLGGAVSFVFEVVA